MILAAVNANRRLHSMRAGYDDWIRSVAPDLLIVSEPCGAGRQPPGEAGGLQFAGGSSRLAAYAAPSLPGMRLHVHDERWIEVELTDLRIHGVYLDANAPRSRTALLDRIRRHILDSRTGNLPIVIGDFNLAPEPQDGMHGNNPSTFTAAHERAAFRALLQETGLIDLHRHRLGPRTEFTIERGQDHFRCDLCLCPRSLEPQLTLTVDHGTRLSRNLSDHSALVIRGLPASPATAGGPEPRTAPAAIPKGPRGEATLSANLLAAQSSKTAIGGQPSATARQLTGQGLLKGLNIRRILDFGCGKRRDFDLYRKAGFDADGYDQDPDFTGIPRPEAGGYDLVVLNYVVHVLPDDAHRLQALREARATMRPGGCMLVVVRSRRTIETEAAKGWTPCGDGYISSESKGTFQRGYDRDELRALLEQAGLETFDGPPLRLQGATYLWAR
jgi:hypothetical protein